MVRAEVWNNKKKVFGWLRGSAHTEQHQLSGGHETKHFVFAAFLATPRHRPRMHQCNMTGLFVVHASTHSQLLLLFILPTPRVRPLQRFSKRRRVTDCQLAVTGGDALIRADDCQWDFMTRPCSKYKHKISKWMTTEVPNRSLLILSAD